MSSGYQPLISHIPSCLFGPDSIFFNIVPPSVSDPVMNYLLLRFAAETRVLLLLFFHELLYVDIGKTLARQATPDSPECVTIMLLASVLVNLTSEKEG